VVLALLLWLVDVGYGCLLVDFVITGVVYGCLLCFVGFGCSSIVLCLRVCLFCRLVFVFSVYCACYVGFA